MENLGKFIILIGIILVIFGAVLSPADAQEMVRVAVKKDIKDAVITLKSPYKILTLYTNEELLQGKKMRNARVLPTNSGIKIGDEEFKVFGVKVWTKKNPTIFVNNRKFRGTVDIVRTKDLKLLFINEVPMEDYLQGVLNHEVSHRWPIEAIKAQAIAARTFALYQMQCNKGKDFDVTSDTSSQMYGGATSEKSRTNRAAKQTQGLVLTYDGKLLPSYYHASCAGHTEDVSQLWNDDLAPLKGVKCDFCARSPHHNWTKKIELKTLEDKLEASGRRLGKIISIDIEDRDLSGRITNLIVNGTQQSSIIKAKDFRSIIGSNIIRSANFDVEVEGGYAVFKGIGWGHGVGMCQWGAYFMSKKGYKAEEILKYYYPGAKIENYETVRF